MATYAQLQSESWWGREIRTEELRWLGDELCRRTNQPRTAAGDKGDRFHLNGAHRSQEWIKRSVFCTNRTYTVQSGLTAEQERHIGGFDFTPGSVAEMIAQCRRLLAALRAGRLEEVLEFYGNVDGDRVVDGWNNLRDQAATSDSSHLWHWHLTIDRRKLKDRRLMERILALALGTAAPPTKEDKVELSSEDVQAIAKATVDEMVRRKISKLTGDAPEIGIGSALSWTHKNGYDTRTAVLETLVPGQAAILAAVAGHDVVAATQQAIQEQFALLGPALAEQLDDVPAEQIEQALRNVLGSLDNGPPA